MQEAESRMKHWLPFVRIVVLIGQKDDIWYVVFADEEDQQGCPQTKT